MKEILKYKIWNSRRLKNTILAIIAAALMLSAFGFTQPAKAHCDSYQGPVVQAAQKALNNGNIKLVLPYVKPDDEAELTAAFKHALAVRKLGGDAAKLADEFFFETTVRLHRQGEGAVYTGLKDEPVPAAITAADKAMQTGNLNDVTKLLSTQIEEGLATKYQAVVDARANARKLGTVEALRVQAEAELIFEKYVYGIYTSATADEVEAEGQAHTH